MLEYFLPLLRAFILWITLKRVLLVTATALTLITSFTIYENREMVINVIDSPPNQIDYNRLKISAELSSKLSNIFNNHAEVAYVVVIGANVARNQQDVVYWAARTPQAEVDMMMYLGNGGTSQALLSTNSLYNRVAIKAINGEFACYPANDTSALVSTMKYHAKVSCYTSIPPYFGQFAGYLLVGVKTKLDQIQQVALHSDMIEISNEIYLTSFKRLLR